MEVITAENYDYEKIELTSKKHGDVLEFEVRLSGFSVGKWIFKRFLVAMVVAGLFYALLVNF